MEDKRVTVAEECVEPELLGPGASPRGQDANGPRPEEVFASRPAEKPGIFTRLKMFLAGLLTYLSSFFIGPAAGEVESGNARLQAA